MKKFRLILVSLMFIAVSAIAVSGAQSRALYFSTAEYYSVPGGGTCQYRLGKESRNEKVTWSTGASIRGVTNKFLKGTSRIVNNEGLRRSDDGLLDAEYYRVQTSATINYGYYNRACTNALEASNESRMTVNYSSDDYYLSEF